jgi:hypothetical protein
MQACELQRSRCLDPMYSGIPISWCKNCMLEEIAVNTENVCMLEEIAVNKVFCMLEEIAVNNIEPCLFINFRRIHQHETVYLPCFQSLPISQDPVFK